MESAWCVLLMQADLDWANFRQLDDFLLFGTLLKITQVAHILWLLLSTDRVVH
jgi:hypothetical protein